MSFFINDIINPFTAVAPNTLCDVIWENPAYAGTKNRRLSATSSYVF